jgi:hypothetical protein
MIESPKELYTGLFNSKALSKILSSDSESIDSKDSED